MGTTGMTRGAGGTTKGRWVTRGVRSLANMRPSSVTPARCVRSPPWRQSTHTPRGSPLHDCRLMTCEKRNKRQVRSATF